MTWVMRIFAALGFWFALSIAVFGILPALRQARRRNTQDVWISEHVVYRSRHHNNGHHHGRHALHYDQDNDR